MMIGRTACGAALLLLAVALAGCQSIDRAGPVPRSTIVAAFPHPGGAARLVTPALDENMLGWVNRMVEASMEVNDIPGFAIGIIRDGQVVDTKGYGVAGQLRRAY